MARREACPGRLAGLALFSNRQRTRDLLTGSHGLRARYLVWNSGVTELCASLCARMKGWLRYSGLAAISPSRKRSRKVKSELRKKFRASVRRIVRPDSPFGEDQNHEQQLQGSAEEAERSSEDLLEESVSLVADAEEVEEENTSYVINNGDLATVYLRSGQVACMDGCAMVSALQGTVSMLGYILPRGIEVFVCSNSKISPAMCFEPVPSSDSQSPSSEELCVLEFRSNSPGTPCEDGQRPTFKIVVTQMVVTLDKTSEPAPHYNSWTNGHVSDVIEGRKRDTVDSDDALAKDASPESGDDRDEMEVDTPHLVRKRRMEHEEAGGNKRQKEIQEEMRSIILPPSWRSAADVILRFRGGTMKSPQCGEADAPVVAICGAKNAGKSTFGRYLVNCFLNRFESVGYLDTDLGQPEFTVPGCLSLHIVDKPVTGPPAFHLRSPERCFYFGDVSPKSDPELYVRHFVSLYRHFQERFVNTQHMNGEIRARCIPLVINTHGWLKGVGYDLLAGLLRHICPTHVVQVRSQTERKNLPHGQFWSEGSPATSDTQTLYISSPAGDDSLNGLSHVGRSATHMRGLRVLAYFQQCLGRNFISYPFKEDKLFMQTAFDLVCQRPYVVSAADVKVLHLHSEVPESVSLCSINGTLVGLGVSSIPGLREKADLGDCQPFCIGFGIVRGVDLTRGLIYVITPLTLDELAEVAYLLQGRVKLPLPLLQAKGFESPYLCLNSVAVEGTGAAVMKTHKGTPRKAAE